MANSTNTFNSLLPNYKEQYSSKFNKIKKLYKKEKPNAK